VPPLWKRNLQTAPKRTTNWRRNLQTAPTRQQLSSKIFLCGKEINNTTLQKERR